MASERTFILETDAGTESFPLCDGERKLTVGNAVFLYRCESQKEKRKITLSVLSGTGSLFATLRFFFDDWSAENYLLMPASVYDGNRVTVLDHSGKYAPRVPAGYVNVDPPQLTGTVHRLEVSGGGFIEQTSGEYAFPSLGFFDRRAQHSCWVLTAQKCEAGNYSYTVTESEGGKSLELKIAAPLHRKIQRDDALAFRPVNDPAFPFEAGTVIHLEFAEFHLSCASMREFFHQSFQLRNVMVAPGKRPDIFPYSQAAKLLGDRLRKRNWREDYGYHATLTENFYRNPACKYHYQLGWCGSAMITEYLLLDGDATDCEHAKREFDFLCKHGQLANGFFNTSCWDDHFFPDIAKPDGSPESNHMLVRKNADGFHYFARQMLLLQSRGETLSPLWLNALRRWADAFANLWERYGQFGYRIDATTGDMIVGGGAGGVPASPGLLFCSLLFGNERYMKIARESGLTLAKRYLEKGVVYGAVGDALQATDSESACSLLEALVTLWEYTGDREIFDYAEFAAEYLATWCVAYDYDFPATSCFGQLGMTTAGTVYANIQNRHSAPGFCTASGHGFFKLYRATGKKEYLDLICDVVHSLPQYVCRRDRVIRNLDFDSINERVNMGDWEGTDHIGEVFNCACWPEGSLFLSRIQLPGVYLNTDTGMVACFDHVRGAYADGVLTLTNPTAFDAEVTIFAENSAEAKIPLKFTIWRHLRRVSIPAGGQIKYEV